MWEYDFGFWVSYVEQNMIRASLYLEDLHPSEGIELDQANLDAVRLGLDMVLTDVSSCRASDPQALRSSIASLEGVSGKQKQALLAMTEIPERLGFWNLPCPLWTGASDYQGWDYYSAHSHHHHKTAE